jgi:hypothetical protein
LALLQLDVRSSRSLIEFDYLGCFVSNCSRLYSQKSLDQDSCHCF